MEFEILLCPTDADRMSLYVQTAALLDSFVPVDVLDELCVDCKNNLVDAMGDTLS